jgi:hypothetical protein
LEIQRIIEQRRTNGVEGEVMTQKVTLIITERGDSSVGEMDQMFDVVFPYEVDIKDAIDLDSLSEFQGAILMAYSEFTENKLSADWDFDLKNEAQNEH